MQQADEKIQLALIYGSTRTGRFCEVVGNWAAGRVRHQEEFELSVIDPLRLELPFCLGEESSPDLSGMRRLIHNADAFVVVTPEYNHGYPAALKQLIDLEYEGWRTKPVAFVSYGGVSGGLRAVEQLRQVFCELHAMTVRDSVSFANAGSQFDAQGDLLQPERAQRSMSRMLDQLSWWALALRNARSLRAYAG